jgi:hypothetical protein
VAFVVCPLTYVVALGVIALISFIAERATPKITVVVGGHPLTTETGAWFAYAWYSALAIQAVALLHAVFCFVIIWRYRANTSSALLKAVAIVLALSYLAFVTYCAYGLVHPDPNIQPIVDNHRSS